MERFLEVLGSIVDTVIFLICDNIGEMRFDELRKMWYYTDGKVKVYIKETYKETGPTFTGCLLKAFLYEVDHLDDDQPKKES